MNTFYINKLLRRFYDRLTGKTATLYLDSVSQKVIFDKVKKIKEESGMLLEIIEGISLYNVATTCMYKDEHFAEIGVYTGGSAKIISEAIKYYSPAIKFRLFDTFAGIPEDDWKSEIFKKGMFNSDLEKVKYYLKDYDNIEYYPGIFPDSMNLGETDNMYSFVHIDVDTYQSTLACMKYFVPHMVSGGIILVHDYSTVLGVNSAVYIGNVKNWSIVKLPGSQAMIICQ
jgi:hypothetical protein